MTSNVQVKFESLIPSLGIPDDPYNIPIDSSIEDLNDIITSLTNQEIQYDFFVQDLLLTCNLGQFLHQNNIATEETILIQCSVSPRVPSLVSSANTPDWISCIAMYKSQILAANYDGSLEVIQEEDNEIKVLDSKLLSTHAMKHISVLDVGIAVSGESGDVKILSDLSGAEIAEFKLNQTPILNMGVFCGSLFTYSEDFALKVIAPDNIEFMDSYVKKGVLRGNQCNTDLSFDFEELHPVNVFEGNENLFLSLDSNILDYYNIFEEKHILKIPGPALVSTVLQYDSELIAGYMDRGIRMFDLRVGTRVERSYLGHESHIQRICRKNEYQFFSADVSGTVYLWDIRASRPYHKIDCYDYEIDKRNDEGRILDCVCDGSNLYVGGSARKLFWYEI